MKKSSNTNAADPFDSTVSVKSAKSGNTSKPTKNAKNDNIKDEHGQANARPADGKPLVAYFCMEYGLDDAFKIYSGGLGILAGDLIKAARDAGFPMVAVGILWRQGYTSQTIGENGLPVDAYPEYRYDFLKDTGVTVSVKIKESDVNCKVWLCDCFSNIPLYLLDAFLPDNPEQLVTGQLYGWFEEERLAQEIILGVGGVRALDALGIAPDVYHFNEGHAALAGLELISREMEKPGGESLPRSKKFQAAWNEVRQKIVFTTHTPVVAGNESHGYRALQYTGANLGFLKAELEKIGGEPFNMTIAGLHLSRGANAVAELHAVTAAEMWAGVKNRPVIIPITNGVHNMTWQDAKIAKIMASSKPAPDAGISSSAQKEAGKLIWRRHTELKKELIGEVAERTGVRLNKDSIIVGFARRAAPYKRSDLIFRNEALIESLLNEGKLQLVFSGKAHPNDLTGKAIVSNLSRMAARYPGCVVFLQNYDMHIGALMTRGCDVWLNNPLRPQEASGTSGMKAAMNGVLNFSILDGWWPEGCEHGVNGWQMGGGYEGEGQDAADTESLYKVLTGEIIPTYYDDRQKWIDMMISSIEMSQYKFSAARMLDDYINKLY